MNIIINDFVFSKQQENLVQLGAAIEDVGTRVLRLLEGLPEEKREGLEKEFGDVLLGIHVTCCCLAIVAQTSADNAEEWALWANREKIQIHYRG
ncbi:MAG: hypothetical protein H7X83_00890 [Verrucomicrobia bacterium]|nr:hypothetical protein [Deltaproteobacteria bacterium]